MNMEKKVKVSYKEANYLIDQLQDILANYLHGGESDEVIAKFEELLDIEGYSSYIGKGLKLKPFDLEAAKSGKPVCTRDGRKARIICTNVNNDKPIVAVISYENGKETYPYTFYSNGLNMDNKVLSNTDLMMYYEKKEGWLNIYKKGEVRYIGELHPSVEEAEKQANERCVATVRIEWEE